MKDKGVNIEQLKTKIELNGHTLSRNSIGNILNGKNSPKVETLEIIANALEVDLWRIFSTESEDNSVSGYIETKDTIYRIHSLKELKQLLKLIEKPINDSKFETHSESSKYRSFSGGGLQYYAVRGSARKKTEKFSRHIFKKYNITVCNKKEFIETPNELSRDVKVWVFKSKDDVKSAQTLLEKQLKFKFNE
ncbi:helix-turn-helix domain-containing protein [Maribellus mangrovi]|uniref:helix-turn-helix domain-containing protein n=1 Tax=Maribellus mangrovi TaxID=3133146 RepID=UPI003F581920